MKTLVIGANGKIGKIICTKCSYKQIPLLAMIRDKSQSDYFSEIGVETVIADLEKDFSYSFKDVSRIVFTAGSGAHTGGDKTLLVDLYGAIRAIDLCHQYDIKHFIMISALRAENPMNGPEKIRHYLVAKMLADEHLVRSGINYTILRPGKLTDDPASGLINTCGSSSSELLSISRENVGLTVLECFGNQSCFNRIIPLLDGEIPIDKAFN